MNPTKHPVLCGLVATLFSQASWAMAQLDASCYWIRGSGPMVLSYNIGTVYVPRDALPGTVIGRLDGELLSGDPINWVDCRTSKDSTRTLEFEARASVPIFAGPLPPVNGEDVTGKVLQTNIPGVGVRIKLGFPFGGRPDPNNFLPIGEPIVPFRGERPPVLQLIPVTIRGIQHWLTLIKTGPIPPGPHQFNGSEMFSGNVSDLNRIFGYGFTGTLIQAQCSVSVNPVSADPVRLGDWASSDFTGPGFTTTAVPFSIALSNCETDPADSKFATAHIRLEGINGSKPVGEASKGVFSLTSDSIASGIGIQVLKEDGITPLKLSTEVPVQTVTAGNMALHFNARFYQTAASRDLRPGLAKGALSFTLTYR